MPSHIFWGLTHGKMPANVTSIMISPASHTSGQRHDHGGQRSWDPDKVTGCGEAGEETLTLYD